MTKLLTVERNTKPTRIKDQWVKQGMFGDWWGADIISVGTEHESQHFAEHEAQQMWRNSFSMCDQGEDQQEM